MADAGLELQRAMVTALKAALPDIPVRDYSPDMADLPYIEVGEIDGQDWSTDSFEGQELTIQFHVWSRFRGKEQALEIMGRIKDAMAGLTFELSGFTAVTLRFDYRTTQFEPDGKTVQGVIRFRALIHEDA